MMLLTRDLPGVVAVPLSALSAGFVLSFVLSPAELIKCRMQLGRSDPYHRYTGPLDCLRHLLRTEGLRGLGRGLPATMAREMPGNAVYFSAYQSLRHLLPGRAVDYSSPRTLREQISDIASAVLCGGVAGVALWAAVLPLDVAKTRVQTAYPGSKHDYGVLGQLRVLWREGGRAADAFIRRMGGLRVLASAVLLPRVGESAVCSTAGKFNSLYAGLSPTLVRAFPAK
jgi:hypothetical protein